MKRPAEGDSVIATLRAVPAPVWALLVGTFINKLGSFLQVFLVLFLTSRGLSADQAGLVLGAYGTGAVLGVVAGGGVTDRIGCRATISASMVVAGALTAAMLSTTDPVLLMVIAFFTGGSAQAYRPASSALLAALTPEERHVMVFALYRLAFNLGMTIGPLVGAFLVASASYAVLFWADAVTSVVFGFLCLAALPGGRAGADDTAGDEDQPAAAGYRRVLADRRYSLFVFGLFINAIVYIQYLSALPLHLEDVGFTAGVFGVIVAINGFVVIACELPVTKVVQRWSARLAVPLGVGLIGLGLAMYAGPAAIPWLVVATVVWSAGEIIGAPTASAYPVRVAPPGLRGRYLGAAAGAQNVGYAVGPVIGAAVWSRTGTGVWWLCGILTVAAVAACIAGIERGAERAKGDAVVPSPPVEPAVAQEVGVV